MTTPFSPIQRTNAPLVEHLRRWRTVFVGAAGLAALVLVTTFAIERRAVDRSQRSAEVLRTIGELRRSTWLVESAVRAYGLRADASAPARAAVARSAIASGLADLRRLVANDAAASTRVAELSTALARWDTTFVAPILATGTITAAIAVAATATFEDVSTAFDGLSAEESRSQRTLVDHERRLAWAIFAILLTLLAVVAFAFNRIGKGLVAEAELSREQQRRLEEQSAELEEQARTLGDQAGLLEEQAAELEHRIEERDETNRLLEHSNAFLDSALESAPLAIAFYDRDLRFLRINDALARMNGHPAEAHVGQSLEAMVPTLAPFLRPILTRVLTTGKAVQELFAEGDLTGIPGKKRRWMSTYYPIRAGGRELVGVGAMVLDVTERTQLEEQLRQAQKMEAVGRLAGGVAHDFNNVLTIIQSYAELLIAELPNGTRGHTEVEAIRAAADRAAALARQLLAFSRRQVVIPRVLDVNSVVRGMEGILNRLLRQGIDLEVSLSPDPQLVRMDSGQLEQVLMNLAINAVDAMPKGGRLSIATRSVPALAPPEGGASVPAVGISVRDTGTGITADVRERLFEPFFTTKPPGQGTGLGLATAYAIVREAGGVIHVESAPGNGSHFEVVLPARAPAEQEPESRLSPIRGVPMAAANETVLIVEDEPAIRSALARMLRAHGYHVLEASNGGEALRVAETETGQIDLLLTDVRMPGIGGKELVQRLLRIRPGTRVILMSGYTDDELLREELGDARYVFLQKPFAARAVVAAVRALLSAD